MLDRLKNFFNKIKCRLKCVSLCCIVKIENDDHQINNTNINNDSVNYDSVYSEKVNLYYYISSV